MTPKSRTTTIQLSVENQKRRIEIAKELSMFRPSNNAIETEILKLAEIGMKYRLVEVPAQ